jgi:hypothetical protein
LEVPVDMAREIIKHRGDFENHANQREHTLHMEFGGEVSCGEVRSRPALRSVGHRGVDQGKQAHAEVPEVVSIWTQPALGYHKTATAVIALCASGSHVVCCSGTYEASAEFHELLSTCYLSKADQSSCNAIVAQR